MELNGNMNVSKMAIDSKGNITRDSGEEVRMHEYNSFHQASLYHQYFQNLLNPRLNHELGCHLASFPQLVSNTYYRSFEPRDGGATDSEALQSERARLKDEE